MSTAHTAHAVTDPAIDPRQATTFVPNATRPGPDGTAATPNVPPGAPAGDDDEARWAAVAARDRAHDGRFVYAVSTTGVYCRPSCASRRARRAHVSFHASPAAAEAAGFRACKRCTPDQDATAAEAAAARLVARARAYLDAAFAARPDAPVPLAELARAAGASPHHLQRTFARLTGVSPKQYLAALRAERLKARLRAGDTVSRATFEAGYGAASRAYAAAAGRLGMTPAAYRRGGRGAHVRYATAGTALGRLLVAATARGVCAVLLGDDDAALERELAAEYPRAERERADAEALGAGDPLGGWLAQVAAHLDGTSAAGARPELGVPVDVAGTPFQERVWGELRRIPHGETRSYAQVAAAVGAPRAVRAVAGACARNRVALVVPCHRVVPSGVKAGASAGGYRWGAERKRALLERERAAAPRQSVNADAG